MVETHRLYMDIDGVIYGYYAGCWQIRPYTKTLLDWASSAFTVYWTTYNSQRKHIRDVIGAGGHVIESLPQDGLGKLGWIRRTGGLEGSWLIVEDTAPTPEQREVLAQAGCLNRWLVVPDFGGDVLLDVQRALQDYLIDGKLRVPEGWRYGSGRDEGRSIAPKTLWTGARNGRS